MKKTFLLVWASLSLFAAFVAQAAEQQLFTVSAGKDGSGLIQLQSSDEPQPKLQKFTITGTLLGKKINEIYTPVDLEQMRKSGKPRTIINYMGADALTFLPLPDFTIAQGGGIRVGYATGVSSRKQMDVQLDYDPVGNRWWMIYTKAPKPIRLSGINVQFNKFLGQPTGIKKVEGIDEFGRIVQLPGV